MINCGPKTSCDEIEPGLLWCVCVRGLTELAGKGMTVVNLTWVPPPSGMLEFFVAQRRCSVVRFWDVSKHMLLERSFGPSVSPRNELENWTSA